MRVGSIDDGALRTIVRARFGGTIPPATREAIVQTYERFARGNGGREDGEAEEVLAGEEAGRAAAGDAPSSKANNAKAVALPPPPTSSMLRAAPIGPRDLIKWCERVVANAARLGFAPALSGAGAGAERAYHAAEGHSIWPVLNRGMATEHVTEARRAEIIAAGVDVLVASSPSHRARLRQRTRIHRWWGIAPPRLDDAPEVSVEMVAIAPDASRAVVAGTKQILHVGRVALALPAVLGVSAQWRAESAAAAVGELALADCTLRMLQRVAPCVAQREPALLVGETGCGKTAMVQALAKRFGARLVVRRAFGRRRRARVPSARRVSLSLSSFGLAPPPRARAHFFLRCVRSARSLTFSFSFSFPFPTTGPQPLRPV